MMEIELNGAPHVLVEPHDLERLVASLNLSHQALAVAINREVVPRHLWSQRQLEAADRVEIVRAIGGG